MKVSTCFPSHLRLAVFDKSAAMPLIVMCGYPCSGKTRRAEELKEYFEQNTDRKVHIVGDGGLDVDRNTVYAGKLR